MGQSKIDQAKEIFIYAPLGAFKFLKENLPAYISVFASMGKTDIQPSVPDDSEPELQEPQKPTRKQKIDSTVSEMTSDITKAKNLFYSAVGAFDFVKKSSPLVGGIVNERGKKKVTEQTQVIGEKVSSATPSFASGTIKKTEQNGSEPTEQSSNQVEALIKDTGRIGVQVASSAFGLSMSLISGLDHTLRNCASKIGRSSNE